MVLRRTVSPVKITSNIDYAAAPSKVFEMLSDEGFQRRKCEATGALSYTVSVAPRGDHVVIVTTRSMPTASFPDFVRSFVGATLDITETDDWGPASADGSRRGTIAVQVAGAPLTVNGTLALVAQGSATVEQIDCDMRAAVPLLGGKIERAAAPAIETGIAVEHRTGQAWLSQG